MRLITRSALIILLVVPVAGSVASARGPADPFRGAWKSVDAADGSNQTLHFGGGGDVRRAGLHDDFASACTTEPQGAVARGDGTITSPTTIEVTFDLRCQKTGEVTEDVVVTFTHDPVAGTLDDDLSPPTTWHRPNL